MPMPYAPTPTPTIPVDVYGRDGAAPWDPRDQYLLGVTDAAADMTEAMLEWVGQRIGPTGKSDIPVPMPLGRGQYVEVAWTGTEFEWIIPTGLPDDRVVVGTVSRSRLPVPPLSS